MGEWTKEYTGRTEPSYDEIVKAVKDKGIDEVIEIIKTNMWEKFADDIWDIHKENIIK